MTGKYPLSDFLEPRDWKLIKERFFFTQINVARWESTLQDGTSCLIEHCQNIGFGFGSVWSYTIRYVEAGDRCGFQGIATSCLGAMVGAIEWQVDRIIEQHRAHGASDVDIANLRAGYWSDTADLPMNELDHSRDGFG